VLIRGIRGLMASYLLKSVMQQIKRNSREFKDVKEIIDEYKDDPTRKKLIRLYSLKPLEKLENKELIKSQTKNAAVVYDLNYELITEYLRDRNKKLFREDAAPLYYFKTSATSPLTEQPFELTGKLKKRAFLNRRSFGPLKKVK
jgi:hypothetical protein